MGVLGGSRCRQGNLRQQVGEASRSAAHLHGGSRQGGAQQGDAVSIAGAQHRPSWLSTESLREAETGSILSVSSKPSRPCLTMCLTHASSRHWAADEGRDRQGTAASRRACSLASLQAATTWRGSGRARLHPRWLPSHHVASSMFSHRPRLITVAALCCCCCCFFFPLAVAYVHTLWARLAGP